MKTRRLVLAAMVAVFATASAFAGEPTNSKLVVINPRHGVYKVIYEGVKPGKVSMKISDARGNQVFSQTLRQIGGFILPVNFEGMEEGAYSVAITDETGTLVQSINYRANHVFKNVFITKTAEEGKYLLAVSSKEPQVINIRITDGENNIVREEQVTVKGNFGVVYNLKKVNGTPGFEVTDEKGNDLISK